MMAFETEMPTKHSTFLRRENMVIWFKNGSSSSTDSERFLVTSMNAKAKQEQYVVHNNKMQVDLQFYMYLYLEANMLISTFFIYIFS